MATVAENSGTPGQTSLPAPAQSPSTASAPPSAGSTRVFTVLGADTHDERQAIRAAGCTHAVINAYWADLQPERTQTLEPSRLLADYSSARALGLSPTLSVNLNYPPPWVLSGPAAVPPFVDVHGQPYPDPPLDTGAAVRNWMTTAYGRSLVADLVSRTATALGPGNVAATSGCRLGGGPYGELHVPPLGDPAVVADLVDWARWLVGRYTAAGFAKNLYLLLPGFGARPEQDATDPNKIDSLSRGEDHAAVVEAFAGDPAVVPYCTWLNTTTDSSGMPSPWLEIARLNAVNGDKPGLVGENVSTADRAAQMATIGTDALSMGWSGIAWLNYASLTAGDEAASLADLARLISSLR